VQVLPGNATRPGRGLVGGLPVKYSDIYTAQLASYLDTPFVQYCRSLTISLNEEQLALGLENGGAYTLALNNQELMKPEDNNFEVLGSGAHCAGRFRHRTKDNMLV
jgi:hypothetical protein